MLRLWTLGWLASIAVGCTGTVVAEPDNAPAPAPDLATAAAPEAAAVESVDASRTVTLGAGVTEVVFALGAGEHVVAADSSSRYPEQAGEKATLGFFRKIAAEGVLSQSPTLVLASEGTGPPTTLTQLTDAGVRVERIGGATSLEDARGRMTRLGEILGKQQQAAALVATMDAELKAVTDATADWPRPKVLFIYARGGGTMMVAGDETSAKTVIEAAGGTSAVTGHEGYRPLTAEAVAIAAPDVILLTSGGLESMGGVDGVLGAPGVAATPAGEQRRVIAIDDHLLLAMGPRTGEAVRALAREIHGELPGLSNGEDEG